MGTGALFWRWCERHEADAVTVWTENESALPSYVFGVCYLVTMTALYIICINTRKELQSVSLISGLSTAVVAGALLYTKPASTGRRCSPYFSCGTASFIQWKSLTVPTSSF
jgi:hypothetical protein